MKKSELKQHLHRLVCFTSNRTRHSCNPKWWAVVHEIVRTEVRIGDYWHNINTLEIFPHGENQ